MEYEKNGQEVREYLESGKPLKEAPESVQEWMQQAATVANAYGMGAEAAEPQLMYEANVPELGSVYVVESGRGAPSILVPTEGGFANLKTVHAAEQEQLFTKHSTELKNVAETVKEAKVPELTLDALVRKQTPN